jgi:hypothetical protein
MNRHLSLLMMAVVGVGVGIALSSCNFHPPSKAWKEVIDRDLLIEELHCWPEIPGPTGPNGPHCHLVVKKGVGDIPEPTRYLRVTKPFGQNYRITIVTPAMDKSVEDETGMTCDDLLESGKGYELNGYCHMDHAPSSKAESHDHVFHAWMQPFSVRGEVKWRVDFDFIHDKLSVRHNGTGHTQAQ